MADEAGPSARGGDSVAGDASVRDGLKEALRQILREEPELVGMAVSSEPTGPPPTGKLISFTV